MKNPIEVVTAYVDALGKGDIPTAFSFLIQMLNGINLVIINFLE
ncbi:hypothetical protein QNH98_17380 [Myroides sp. mNGS23_01]|nr:hypothetical protein [Myroides sp. mNGS23_01]WHT38737.1 hypothetical protein QNH98_17380 [Myroides sp. mNGS23_01]